MATMTMISNVMRMTLRARFFPINSCRGISSAANNFVVGAGFSSETANSNYGTRPLFLLDQGKTLSYMDVNRRSGQFASLLNQKYGIKRGDRILCRVSKTTDNACLYLAALRIGAVYVPLNPAYTPSETAHFVEDARPSIFVTNNPSGDGVFADRVREAVLDEMSLGREANSCLPILDVEHVASSDLACILYTSGTTGKPKGAMISHGALRSNAETLVDCWRFVPSDINLHSSATIFHPKFTAEAALRDLPRATVFMGVPTFFARLAESPQLTPELVKNVRLFISGSATLLASVFDDFLAKTSKRICERYGMTETLVSTSNPVDDEAGRLPGSAGQSVPGVQTGVVEVKSEALFSGYLNLPEKTRQEFTTDGFFITGDMGEIDDKGYLWIRGRQKDLIISGGLNVYPIEVEKLLDDTEWVKESAVIGVPHVDFGEAVVAVCVLEDALQASDTLAQTIGERLRNELAGYKRPKRIFFIDAFPRNHLGKVQKNLLRERYAKTFKA